MKVFLSAPISVVDSTEYAEYNEKIIQLKHNILRLSNISEVFYAGDQLKNTNFDSPQDALFEDISELRTSDIFILIYPRKYPTSAIFEAGVAYELNKRLFFYYKKNEGLPFLMRGVNEARIFEYSDLSEIILDFEKNY